MKKIILMMGVALSSLFTVSCEEARDIIAPASGDSETSIADGLKEALRVGTDSAVTQLTATDGYFGNAALKLLLPPEGEAVLSKLRDSDNSTIQGLYASTIQTLEDDMVLALNRAAEDAAQEAKPIFVNAITGITIDDASKILFGDDTTAATTYLKDATFTQLVDTYSPKMDASLDKKLVGNLSANSTWDNLVSKYNGLFEGTGIAGLAQTAILEGAGLEKIETTDLSDYATEKALTGLFVKVSEEESAIRSNPLARVNDILEDIFGQLDDQ